MKVVILSDAAAVVGGAPKVAIESALALALEGVEVTFFHALAGPVDARLAAAGIEVLGLGLRDVWQMPRVRGAAAAIWNPQARRRLAELLDRFPSGGTIVHLHGWTRALSPSVFAALRGAGLPFVVTAHEYFLACPTGALYRADANEACTLRPLSGACLAAPCDGRGRAVKAVRVARSLAVRAALGGVPLHVAHVSDASMARLAPLLPPEMRHHRVDNPVDAVQGPAASLGPNSRALILGRLVPEKGFAEAVTAARLAGLGSLVVGSGPTLDAVMAADPGAEHRPWVGPGEITALLRDEARVLVAPSRWPEPGPLTVYEALAAGVPVVTTGLCGAAERVTHGVDGFVTSPDVAALTTALSRFGNLDTARAMGATARLNYWRDPPTSRVHAARLIRLYDELLGAPPACVPGPSASRASEAASLDDPLIRIRELA